METKIDEIVIKGITYVPKGSEAGSTHEYKDNYVLVRTRDAGVFAGFLDKKEGIEITLTNARRIWYWDGAASLSQLSIDGVSKPHNCKFPAEVKSVILQWIEILPVTQKAYGSIKGVKEWKA